MLACLAAGTAQAQTYPNRPIRLILPYTAGSPNDAVARLFAPFLSAQLGQPVVVDNRPGGGTTVGVNAVMQAAPDGYTLLFSNSPSHQIAPLINETFVHDPIKDFVPIATVGASSNVIIINSGAAGEDRAGVRRLRQGQSRQAQLRLRPGHAAAARRRDVQDGGEHRHRERALQGRNAGRRPT